MYRAGQPGLQRETKSKNTKQKQKPRHPVKHWGLWLLTEDCPISGRFFKTWRWRRNIKIFALTSCLKFNQDSSIRWKVTSFSSFWRISQTYFVYMRFHLALEGVRLRTIFLWVLFVCLLDKVLPCLTGYLQSQLFYSLNFQSTYWDYR